MSGRVHLYLADGSVAEYVTDRSHSQTQEFLEMSKIVPVERIGSIRSDDQRPRAFLRVFTKHIVSYLYVADQ